MKKTLCLLFFILGVSALYAQSVSVTSVMSDTEMKEYKWAVGQGLTLEEADRNAMNTLVSYATNITIMTTGEVSTNQGSNFKQESVAMSNLYLENVQREVLPELNGVKRVIRYIKIDDWNKRNSVLKGKIEEYINSGHYALMIEDKIRYYSWAYALMNTYHDESNPILIDNKPAKAAIYSAIREGLNNMSISVIGIENDKNNRNYPYKLFLDFTYEDMPIGFLQFDYFDGNAWVQGETIKDGRGVVLMKQLTPELQIKIDCIYLELARQLDPSVYVLLRNPYCVPSFVEAQKRIATEQEKVSVQKEVDTTAKEVESVVSEKIKEVEKCESQMQSIRR